MVFSRIKATKQWQLIKNQLPQTREFKYFSSSKFHCIFLSKNFYQLVTPPYYKCLKIYKIFGKGQREQCCQASTFRNKHYWQQRNKYRRNNCISRVLSFPRFRARDKGNSVAKLLQLKTTTSCRLGKLRIPRGFLFHTHSKFDKSSRVSFFKRETIPLVFASLWSMSNIICTASELCTSNSSKVFK